jgi:hypothetical protein
MLAPAMIPTSMQSLILDPVAHMRDELGGPRLKGFQRQRRNSIEESLSSSQRQRRDVQPDFVEQASGEVLINRRRTSGD